MNKVRACTKCGCPVWWDDTVKNPSPRPKKEWGWWKEDLTKEIHWNRCDSYSKTSRPTADNKLDTPKPSSIGTNQVFTFTHLKDDEQESLAVQTRELYEILQVIKLELKEESNPAVIGMIFNALVVKLARGKKDD